MIDRTTKILLALTALALFVNAAQGFLNPKPVNAAGSFSCSGTAKANAWGGTTASIGGYDLSLDCH